MITLLLAWLSNMHSAAQRDFDLREQLAEQATSAAATATSDAWRLGTGDIRLEASSRHQGDLLVQRTWLQARAAWQERAALVRLRLTAYLGGGRTETSVCSAWDQIRDAVDALIILSGDVRSLADRASAISKLRTAVTSNDVKPPVPAVAWTALEQNPTATPSEAFRGAIKEVVAAVQKLAATRIADIQSLHTRFWPESCSIPLVAC